MAPEDTIELLGSGGGTGGSPRHSHRLSQKSKGTSSDGTPLAALGRRGQAKRKNGNGNRPSPLPHRARVSTHIAFSGVTGDRV